MAKKKIARTPKRTKRATKKPTKKQRATGALVAEIMDNPPKANDHVICIRRTGKSWAIRGLRPRMITITAIPDSAILAWLRGFALGDWSKANERAHARTARAVQS